jgi:sec-independent protein translocase protein TatB
MFGIGGQELILILVVALLVFGPKRLPELARSLGKGLGEFRRASNDLRQSLSMDPPPPSQTIRPPSAPAQAGLTDPVADSALAPTKATKADSVARAAATPPAEPARSGESGAEPGKQGG